MKGLIKFILGLFIAMTSVSCSNRDVYSKNGKGGYGPNAAYYYHHHHPAYHPDNIERSTYSRNKINYNPKQYEDNY